MPDYQYPPWESAMAKKNHENREWDQLDPPALEDAIARVADDLRPLYEQSVQSRYLDEHGREKPNPTPVAPPIGYKKQPSIADQMRQMIRQASYEAAQMGAETEEEANDFDVGEDMDLDSPYEHDFEPDPALEHMLALQSAPPRRSATSPGAAEAGAAGASSAPVVPASQPTPAAAK